jgi:DNA repair protein RecN (Recombination protein N)
MLKALTVRDFALVQELDINLQPGLTVITGESGAGKSILLGALGLVVGDRAERDTVRLGARRAEVTAEFDVDSYPAAQGFLADHALEDPDQPGRCLVRRVVNSDGRSRAFINAAPVTLQLLRGLSEALVEIHGQHENQRLAQSTRQLSLLDDYGVDAEVLSACRDHYRRWKQSLEEISLLQATLRSKEDRASLLSYQVDELSTLNLAQGEFDTLSDNHKRLSQAQTLRETLAQAFLALENAEALSRVGRDLAAIDDVHPSLAAAQATLSSATALLDDTARDLRQYDATLDVDPSVLNALDQRLSDVLELARKHKIEPQELPAHLSDLNAELESISTDRSALDTRRLEAEQEESEFRALATQISSMRHRAADEFAGAVSACMQTLGIADGALVLEFQPTESERGLESVEFRVITNPKYPAAALAKIASGGELARISLAIGVVSAEKSALPCLVLDEADVGVGGTTADVVGRLLRNLAKHAQVICVTHAPQVAALGQNHLRVEKTAAQDTEITPLNEAGRIQELARMLAGSGITEKSREYAKTLLEEAGNTVH